MVNADFAVLSGEVIAHVLIADFRRFYHFIEIGTLYFCQQKSHCRRIAKAPDFAVRPFLKLIEGVVKSLPSADTDNFQFLHMAEH